MKFVKSLFYIDGIGKIKNIDDIKDCENWIKNDLMLKTTDWFEYLNEKDTKFYLDWDKSIDREITEEDTQEAYKNQIVLVKRICDIVEDLLGKKIMYFCATRTGNGYYEKYNSNKKKWETGYKLSLRFYFNFGINYIYIKLFLEKINQYDLWDTSPYSKSEQKVNLISCVKNDRDNRILMPYNENGFMKEYVLSNYIIQYTKDCIDILTIKPDKIIKECIEHKKNLFNKKNYLLIEKILNTDILDNISDKYTEWIKVGLALKNDFGEDGRSLYHLFSKKSYKYNENECDNVWDFLNPDGRITIGTIKYYASKENEEKYHSLIYNSREINFYEVFSKSAQEVSDFIQDELDIILKYCRKDWYFYDENTGLWKIIDNPYTAIGNVCKKNIDKELRDIETNEDCDEKKILIDSLKKMYRKVEFYYKNIESHLKNKEEKDFCDKLDKTEGKIFFRNGYYDLEKKKFIGKIDYDDYITETLPFDYDIIKNQESINWVKNKIMEICNNNEIDCDIFLRTLGYALTGHSNRERQIYTLYGPTAGNGKSVLFEIFDVILPIYSKKLDNRCFLQGWNKSHKEFIQLGNKRIVWTDEIPKKKLDVDMIKEFANGSKMSVEKLFGTNVIINICCKLFITTNHSIELEADGGSERRFIQFNFNSKFYENQKEFDENLYNIPEERKFIMDKKFLNKMKEKKMSIIHLLIEYGEKYFEDGLNFPDSIKSESKNSLLDSDPLYQLIISGKLKINTNDRSNDYITSKEELVEFIRGEIEKCTLTINDVKDYMKKYGVIYDRTKQKNGKRGCFTGIKIES